jgi:hypothetical protein
MAAKQGNVKAIVAKGLCLKSGIGGEKNEAKAYECFREAAEKENPRGMFHAGQCLYTGCGVETNQDAGVAMLQRSAEKGFAEAAQALRNIEKLRSKEALASGSSMQQSQQQQLRGGSDPRHSLASVASQPHMRQSDAFGDSGLQSSISAPSVSAMSELHVRESNASEFLDQDELARLRRKQAEEDSKHGGERIRCSFANIFGKKKH